MEKTKQRPKGLKYTGTKYAELYTKLSNFIESKAFLPTEEEFYDKAMDYCKRLKFENIYNAIWAVRKNVNAKKDFILVMDDMGVRYINIKK